MKRLLLFLLCASVIGLSLGFGLALSLVATASDPPPPVDVPSPNATEGAQVETARHPQVDPVRLTPVVTAVERVAPSVVSITTSTPQNTPFIQTRQQTSTSEGSGVVIESDGVVLTNAHVVNHAMTITVTFATGEEYQADIIGIAEELDLAVLQLQDAQDIASVEIGTSADLMLGEPVIAIGNPFGLGHTVTTGVISAINRPLETSGRIYQDFIQTDASINPGNSGGPLLNTMGQLVGINTAIRPDAEGIGFAIPVDRAIKIANDLVNFGEVQIPWLGIDVEDISFRKGYSSGVTIEIEQVHRRGPALNQLQPGDLIQEVDGRALAGRSDLNAYLSAFSTGKSVTLTIMRENQREAVTLSTSELSEEIIEDSIRNVLGIEIGNNRGKGAEVTQVFPDGAFADHGLLPGDRIMAINGQLIRGPNQLINVLTRAKSGHRGKAMFTLRRNDIIGQIILPI